MPLIVSKYVEKDSTRIFAISEFYAVMKSISTPLGGWGQIITPEFPVGVYKCVRFAYHMFGNTMGSLEVVAQGSQETKFTETGTLIYMIEIDAPTRIVSCFKFILILIDIVDGLEKNPVRVIF